MSLPLQPDLRLAASLLLIVLGLLAPVRAWQGWGHDEKAMRLGAPLASPTLAAPLAVGVTVAGALLLLSLVLR